MSIGPTHDGGDHLGGDEHLHAAAAVSADQGPAEVGGGDHHSGGKGHLHAAAGTSGDEFTFRQETRTSRAQGPITVDGKEPIDHAPVNEETFVSLNRLGRKGGIGGFVSGIGEGFVNLGRDWKKSSEILVDGKKVGDYVGHKGRAFGKSLITLGAGYGTLKGLQHLTVGTVNPETGERERHIGVGLAEIGVSALAEGAALACIGKANSKLYQAL